VQMSLVLLEKSPSLQSKISTDMTIDCHLDVTLPCRCIIPPVL